MQLGTFLCASELCLRSQGHHPRDAQACGSLQCPAQHLSDPKMYSRVGEGELPGAQPGYTHLFIAPDQDITTPSFSQLQGDNVPLGQPTPYPTALSKLVFSPPKTLQDKQDGHTFALELHEIFAEPPPTTTTKKEKWLQ